jgi:glucose/arabinose dehydrogenase
MTNPLRPGLFILHQPAYSKNKWLTWCNSLNSKNPVPVCTRWISRLLIVLSLAFVATGQAGAVSVPPGFTDKQIASGLTSPTAMTVLPDGRVLVAQQNGVIKIIKADTLLDTSFYTVQNVDSFSERGCLGIVADPDFASNHFVYIYCTVKDGSNSHNRILRVTEAGDVATADTERVMRDLPNVPAGVQWHMGGALRFGPDGKLYVAVGNHEDLSEDAKSSNSQRLSNPFGKILRLNADGSIPSDNPFFNTAGADQAIFNFGLRNPFSFDIQPGTGLMYINDVGAGSWEEINSGQAGANYGWPAKEGNSSDSRFTDPVYTYSHGMGCAITGGAFYNPPAAQFPTSYVGKYLFADFCEGWIHMLDPAHPDTADDFASGIGNPVNLGIAPDGSLYYLARNQDTGTPTAGAGTVGKISFTNTQVPRITQHPQSQTIFLGDPVTLTVAADVTGLQWQRNGIDIPGATSTSYTIAHTQLTDNLASFTALARNAFGTASSNVATLTVTTNHFPTATINTPAEGTGFSPGDRIAYSGTGTDPEDGALPASAFTWKVDTMHDTHSHPFLATATGAASGTFAVSDFEANMANTWFRLYLSVKDSAGQTNLAVRDIYPRTQISDMTPVATPINGKGPIAANRNNGDDGAITLDRIPYAKGLGVYAPSDVRYNLGGACTGNFISDVGVDDASGVQGSVVFQVFLDNVKAFDSNLLRGSDLRKPVKISVAGKKELRLVVTDGGDGNTFDLADWAGARVTGCPAPVAGPAN